MMDYVKGLRPSNEVNDMEDSTNKLSFLRHLQERYGKSRNSFKSTASSVLGRLQAVLERLKKPIMAIVTISLVLILTWLFESSVKPEGFWSGYQVEVAGIALEIVLVVFLVDFFVKWRDARADRLLRKPVMNKLYEYVIVTQMQVLQSLKAHLSYIENRESDAYYRGSMAEDIRTEALDTYFDSMTRTLEVSSPHLSTEAFARTYRYLSCIQELINAVKQLKKHCASHNPPTNADGTAPPPYKPYKPVSIRAELLDSIEEYYGWISINADFPDGGFFHTAIIQHSVANLPKAAELKEVVDKLEWVEVTST